MSETNRSFESLSSCKRLGPNRPPESKLPFVSLVEFIHYKLSFSFAHVNGSEVAEAA